MLSSAFGLMTAMQSAAALTGPPLAGVVAELVGDHGVTLYLAGGIMCVSVVVYSLVCIAVWRVETKNLERGEI